MYNINRFIEHTLLSSDMTEANLFKLIEEALDHEFLGVCVPPFWVKKAASEIAKSPLQLISVIGFPFGYNLTETKMDEIKRVIDFGTNEIDMVINLSAFKSRHPWTKIELAKCSNLVHRHNCLIKVIIETPYLSDEEIIKACKICVESGIDFVQTTADYPKSGAKVAHVKLMRSNLPSNIGVKASGDIRSLKLAKRLIENGADRLGITESVKIMQEVQRQYDDV